MKQNLQQLYNRQQENTLSHNCEVNEDDYTRVMPKIELLSSLSEIERSLYAVYDMNKRNYLLESVEQKRIFGEEQTGDDGKYGGDVLYRNIHPDDLPFVLETDNLYYKFMTALPVSEKKDYKLVYNFRVKNTEGIYMRYLHQVVTLETAGNGKSWLILIISDLLSDRAGNAESQRRIIHIETGKQHLFSNEEESGSGLLLTKREQEVLSMIARGYDSRNISDKLCISINTVNNHRQNILRKTKAENTTQALLYARRLGLIQ